MNQYNARGPNKSIDEQGRFVMRRFLEHTFVVAAGVAFAGCAIGNTHTYRYAPTQIEAVGKGRVVLPRA